MAKHGTANGHERDDNLVALGAAVRRRRFEAGLSQEALASDCGLHPTNLGKLERGERNSSAQTLIRIAAALGCRVSDLFASAGL
jgi:transcriptional regulator with XRE-family HTH domain